MRKTVFSLEIQYKNLAVNKQTDEKREIKSNGK